MRLTAGEARRAMQAFPLIDVRVLVHSGLVVVAPHPDDESLGCGGLIAACRAEGLPVHIVVVTDGAGSHPNSCLYPSDRLAALRRSEALAAAAELGVASAHVHFLELPDRHVREHGPAAEQAVAALVRIAAGADVMTVTWRYDPHSDHRASFALARTATARLPDMKLWEYPIWGLTLQPEAELDGSRRLSGVRLDIGPYRDAKRRAIAAHVSQTTALIADDPKGFCLEQQVLALFSGDHEIFIEATA